MHTPQKSQPQHHRASSKQQKIQPRPDVQRNVQSDNDAYQTFTQDGDQTPSRKNKKSRKRSNAKKSGAQSDVGEIGEPHIPRHHGQTQRVKATPVKDLQDQAYAGPTFHQSPAPSALPMPSFYSRSVPTDPPVGSIAETTDGTFDIKSEDKEEEGERRESTPLDFLFHAARQARGTPNGASPARLCSQSGSPAPRSPAVRDGDTDFPFEFDGVDESRSTSSTPFSQRLAASKTPKSTSEGGVPLTDEERQAKTAALKKALMPSVNEEVKLGPAFNDNNPFNARNAPASSPQRHTPSPSTPQQVNAYPTGPNPQYFQYGSNSPTRNFTPQTNSRAASSNLRHVYSPDAVPMSPPSTVPDRRVPAAQSPPPRRQLNFEAIYGAGPRPQSEGNPTGHNPKPSLEQGLDDLRRALNMNFPNFA